GTALVGGAVDVPDSRSRECGLELRLRRAPMRLVAELEMRDQVAAVVNAGQGRLREPAPLDAMQRRCNGVTVSLAGLGSEVDELGQLKPGSAPPRLAAPP